MFLHLPGRLAKALLQRSALVGGACEPKIGITQKDLGNLIGVSRESTNRQLRLWEQRGWVRIQRGGIALLSMKELERIAESDSRKHLAISRRTAPSQARPGDTRSDPADTRGPPLPWDIDVAACR
jgi:hypothetical protein